MSITSQAAVLGDTVSIRDLATITRLPGTEVVTDLTEAFRAGLLGAQGDAVVFRHQLVHDAIYQEMPRPVRHALHRDAANALADAGADVLQVADHLVLGATRGDLEAVGWLRQAAFETAAPRVLSSSFLALKQTGQTKYRPPAASYKSRGSRQLAGA